MAQQVNINEKRLYTVKQSISLCKSSELNWSQWRQEGFRSTKDSWALPFQKKNKNLEFFYHMLRTVFSIQLVLQVYIHPYFVCGLYYYFGEKAQYTLCAWGKGLYLSAIPVITPTVSISSWNFPFIQSTFVLLHQWSWVWHPLTRLVEWLHDLIINSNAASILQQIEFLLTGCLSYYVLIWLTQPFGGVHDLIISLMIKFPSAMCYFILR